MIYLINCFWPQMPQRRPQFVVIYCFLQVIHWFLVVIRCWHEDSFREVAEMLHEETNTDLLSQFQACKLVWGLLQTNLSKVNNEHVMVLSNKMELETKIHSNVFAFLQSGCVLKEIWAYWQVPTEDFSRQAFQRVHTLRLLRYFIVFKEGIYPSFKKHKHTLNWCQLHPASIFSPFQDINT